MSKLVKHSEVLQLDPPQKAPEPSLMDKLIEGRKEREKLARQEATQVLGAFEMTPKALLFDTSVAKAHPANAGKHLRWINKTVAEKVQARLMEGYEKVPLDEGGRDLGAEFALFRIPEEIAERKRKRNDEKQKARMSAHNAEVEKTAEQVARILRDKYGFSVDESKILIKE